MALINCSECGKEVSDKASTCPNCGAPIAGKQEISFDPKSHARVTRTGAKWEGIGTILLVLGIVLAIAVNASLGGSMMLGGFIIFIVGRFK